VRSVRLWLAVLIAALTATLAAPSCSASQNPNARLADDQPALVHAFEAGTLAWRYFDSVEAGRYIEQSRSVRASILAAQAKFKAKCGEQAPQCMISTYDAVMRQWVNGSGYLERLGRIERARDALDAIRAILDSKGPANFDLIREHASELLSLLNAATDELRSHGIDVPTEIDTAFQLLSIFVGVRQ
jgi:hypothetical protein